MKYFRRSRFVFYKKEQNGIFFFGLISICIRLFFLAQFEPKPESKLFGIYEEMAMLNYKIENDSIQALSKNRQSRDTLYPFYPHQFDAYKAYYLGLDYAVVESFNLNFNEEIPIRNLEEFNALVGLNERELFKLRPYLKFKKVYHSRVTKNFSKEKKDLNMADSLDLIEVRGIGPYRAMKVLKKRSSIWAFSAWTQVDEIEALDSIALVELKKAFYLKPQVFDKLNINESSFEELRKIPYVTYGIARGILRYRNLFGGFESIDELKKIEGVDLLTFERIALYLTT